jgi:hypothetical protein
VIGPPREEITALPVYWRPTSSRVDEVLVLQVCHFEAVERESLNLYQMFWVFVFTADQITTHLERSDGNKNHFPFIELVLELLTSIFELRYFATHAIDINRDFLGRILGFRYFAGKIMPTARHMLDPGHDQHQFLAVIDENHHPQYCA